MNEVVDFEDLYMQFGRDTEEERIKSGNLLQQLKETRETKHYEFCRSKNFVGKKGGVRYWDKSSNDIEDTLLDENENPNEQHNNDKVSPWNKGTILVMGDRTLNGIHEKLMGPRFKVRAFPGAIVRDFYHDSIPLSENHLLKILCLVVQLSPRVQCTSTTIPKHALSFYTYTESLTIFRYHLF